MKKKSSHEVVAQQSAAEFFSEHQQIAGFDNPGKSLFTSIRELVENSLDAAESIHVLPDIYIKLIEQTEDEHNDKFGISNLSRSASLSSEASEGQANDKAGSKKDKKVEKDRMYYTLTCKDNGCGIPAEAIGDSLGRVLSGSKHGIRQTRGKFGLGAKMALIWAKKSSGQPIKVRSAFAKDQNHEPTSIACVTLDIDIYKNEPRIMRKSTENNSDLWRGTEIMLTMAGQWSIYKGRVLQYLQQLAVITPYANITFEYECPRDSKKNIQALFERRSEQMPAIPTTMLPHPRSLNNITLMNLLKNTQHESISKFLTRDLCGVPASIAQNIESTLKLSSTVPSGVSSSNVSALVQTLRDDPGIRPPAAACLSPAGEYNLRLGIIKELNPNIVATYTDKNGTHEGHPFIVEAAVSIGGPQVREGVNIYRFANRIPLLFETGADVVTQVATKRINWNRYHMDAKKDCIGVFVSIVSTKIPFKGTSKEYIGDDVLELQQSVKRAIQGCCQQLKVNLAKSLAEKEERERKKTLCKYIPDIARALQIVLNNAYDDNDDIPMFTEGSNKRRRIQADYEAGVISEESIIQRLERAVEKFDAESALIAQKDGPNETLERVFIAPMVVELPRPSEVIGVSELSISSSSDADLTTTAVKSEVLDDMRGLSPAPGDSLSQVSSTQSQSQSPGVQKSPVKRRFSTGWSTLSPTLPSFSNGADASRKSNSVDMSKFSKQWIPLAASDKVLIFAPNLRKALA